MWVVAKIKSYSQERIIKRSSFWGKKFKNDVEEFYYPYYEKRKDAKKILTPSLLFINFVNMDFDLVTMWLELEPHLYWFYRIDNIVSVIKDNEMRKFKKGVEEYIEKKKSLEEFRVGSIAKIVRPAHLAGYKGKIKSIKGNYVVLQIFDVGLKSEWKIPLKCVSLYDAEEEK